MPNTFRTRRSRIVCAGDFSATFFARRFVALRARFGAAATFRFFAAFFRFFAAGW
jgi:hypothetical protein